MDVINVCPLSHSSKIDESVIPHEVIVSILSAHKIVVTFRNHIYSVRIFLKKNRGSETKNMGIEGKNKVMYLRKYEIRKFIC